eukprot:Tamp_21086.p1 GENE.Tamp_21086~~Tamp_21086.p1  ORF type:complete len:137 (-),score=11.93 Tamp_21086:278-688(-)
MCCSNKAHLAMPKPPQETAPEHARDTTLTMLSEPSNVSNRFTIRTTDRYLSDLSQLIAHQLGIGLRRARKLVKHGSRAHVHRLVSCVAPNCVHITRGGRCKILDKTTEGKEAIVRGARERAHSLSRARTECFNGPL